MAPLPKNVPILVGEGFTCPGVVPKTKPDPLPSPEGATEKHRPDHQCAGEPLAPQKGGKDMSVVVGAGYIPPLRIPISENENGRHVWRPYRKQFQPS